MTDTIKITDKEKGAFVINARDLANSLGIKQDFNRWINERIVKHNLKENKDYTCSTLKVDQPSGAKYLKEYFLTETLAALITTNSKKHQEEMIEVKKEILDELAMFKELAKNPAKLIEYCFNSIKSLQAKNEQLTTNIKKLEGNDLDVLYYAKEVGAELGISAIALNRMLLTHKVIYRQNGHYHLYLEYAKQGLFREVKENIQGSTLYVSVLKITPKGRLFIKDLYEKTNN